MALRYGIHDRNISLIKIKRTHRTVRIVSRNGHVFNGKGKETDRETETEKGPTLFYTAWVRAIELEFQQTFEYFVVRRK